MSLGAQLPLKSVVLHSFNNNNLLNNVFLSFIFIIQDVVMTSLWVLNLFLMLKLFKFYVFCQTHPLIAGVTFSHFGFIQKKDWKYYFNKYLYQYLWALLISYNVYSYSPKIIWISHVTSIWHLLVLFNRWITGLGRISGYRIVPRGREG